ncbi:MAG: hypothetical protein HC788_10900 [Sphingopyxis sp.]|nr:hypothetical protein [Sphingopyxis sp.]
MPNPAQQRLDAMAKKKGFPSYAAMKAWNEKYRAPVTNTAAPKKKGNFFQSLMSKVHPLNFSTDKVNRTLDKANKKK